MATRAVSDLLDPASVAANRQGELTSAQRSYVGAVTGVRGCGTVLLAAVGFSVLAAFAVATLWLLAESGPSLWPLATAGIDVVGLVICVGSAKSLLRANLVRRDLTEGRIEHAEGVVEWAKGRWVVRTPSRALSLGLARQSLMPGAYMVHYLPLSGWLLSAERRAGPARSPGTADVAGIGDFDPARQIDAQLQSAQAETFPGTEGASILDALAQAHGFSWQALEANRAGRLGEGQSLRLLRSALFSLLGGVLFAGAGVFVGTRVASSDTAGLAGSIVMAIMALTFLGGGLFVIYGSARTVADAVAGRVAATEGPGSRRVSSSGGKNSSRTYYCKVGAARFRVPRATYDALIEDVVYRAYYVPRTGALLSLEPVGSCASHYPG